VPVYRVLYRPDNELPAELLEADRVDLEGELWLVFRRTVSVIGQPRRSRRPPAARLAHRRRRRGGLRPSRRSLVYPSENVPMLGVLMCSVLAPTRTRLATA